MRKPAECAAIAIALACGAVQAQPLNTLSNFQNASWEGVHLYGVSAFTTYVSSAYPLTSNYVIVPNAQQLSGDISYGVSGSVGWQYHHGTRGSFSVLYTGSYNRSENYNSLSAFGHTIRASASWELTPKLTFELAGSGIYQTVADYIFNPSSLSLATQSPATINNVAAAMGVGQFTNQQAASSLTGSLAAAPSAGVSNPATGLLIGNRVLSYATQAGLTYQLSERLSFNVSAVSLAGQNRSGGSGNSSSTIPPQTYIMPRTLGINAGGGLSYSLTSRTSIGLNFEETRSSNQYQGAYTTSGLGSIGRMMGTRWFVHGSGGAGYTKSFAQAYGTPKSLQTIGSGSFGCRLDTQTLLASYNRTSMSSDGFATGTSSSVGGSWSWRPTEGRWGLMASSGWQDLNNTGFLTLHGWNASVAWTMRLPAGMTLATQYVYSKSTGIFVNTTTNVTVNSIRVSINWIPAALQAAAQATAATMQQQP